MSSGSKFSFLALSGLALLLCLALIPAYGAVTGPYTEAESFILEKVKNGQVANLEKRFGPTEANRRIRAEFLSSLLTGEMDNIRVHRWGINIIKAVIVPGSRDFLDLINATITYEVMLTDCIFNVDVNCQDSYFKNDLRLDRSVFRQEAHFLKMHIGKSLYLTKAVFQGRVNFNGVVVDESLNAEGAQFESDTAKLFSGLKIGESAFFAGAKFCGTANFDSSHAGSLWDISRTEFQRGASWQDLQVGATIWSNKAVFRGPANFSSMEVHNYAHFEAAEFHDSAKFGRSHVGKDLLAQGAKFLSREDTKYASFFYVRVDNVASFQDAVFQGPVDLSGMQVGLELQANRAQFLHPKLGLDAVGLNVGTIANFQNVNCTGPVNFSDAVINGQLNASQATFHQEAEFPGLTVTELAEFSDTIFSGPVNFSGAKIGGKFLAEVQKSGTILAGGIFKGPVVLRDAHLFDLVIRGKLDSRGITDPAAPQAVTISELDLRRAVVERTLSIENVVIQKLLAWNLASNGLTILKNVSITGAADLRGSKFLNLFLSRLTWPAAGTQGMQIAGMTYQSIAIEAPPTSSGNKVWNWLLARSPELDWLEHSPFDEGNYLQLERFLSQSGHKLLADKVYISMKRQEIWPQKWYEWLNPVFWSTLIFWDVPVGCGRKPLRTVWFALAFILVGAYFFDPHYLEGVDQPRRNISRRLLLSVDKFIPSMFDLGMETKWHPTSLPVSVRIYNWIHKLTGRAFLAIFFFGVWAYFK